MPDDLYLISGTMIEPRDMGNRCVVVRDYGDSVETFRAADLLRDAASLACTDWAGATWPPTLVARRWWFRVGGYSTELSPGMSSDNDFSMKLWHAGCRTFIGLGDSFVYHFACVSTGRIVKNDGRLQFLHKWGISQRDFDRICLHRGEPVELEAALAGRRLDDADIALLSRAQLRARLTLKFKPAVAFSA